MTFEILVPLFTAGAVFFLSVIVIGVLQNAFEKYRERYLAKQISDLSEMFFFVGPEQLVTLTIAVACIGGAIGLLFFGPVATVLFVVGGFMTPTFLVRFYRRRRVLVFERQLVDALGGLAAAFRAGMSLYQAMEEVAKTSRAPLCDEFALSVREMRLGATGSEALDKLAERVPSDDLFLVVTSVNTARSVGGNMAEMFDTLSGTMRERFRIEGRIRALTAQGKLQAWVIGAIPVLVWIAFDGLRPDLTRPMMQHWFGWGMVGLVVFMEMIGIFFIRKVVAIRV